MSTINFDPEANLQDWKQIQPSTCLVRRADRCEIHQTESPHRHGTFDIPTDTGDLSLGFVYPYEGGYKKVQVIVPAAGVTAFVQHLIEKVDHPFENEILSEIRAIRELLENQ